MALPFSSESAIKRFWLHPMLRVVNRTDAEIRRLLFKAAEAAASDVVRLGPSDKGGKAIRRGQFAAAFQAVNRTLGFLFQDVYDTVKAGRADAAEAAALSSFHWEEPYYRAAGVPKATRDKLRAATTALSDRNVELMLRRFNTQQIPLSRQVYKTQNLAKGWVDQLINIGIGRGFTAREIARDVKQHIRPDVRGGTAYAALRLGRTELNNSFHAAAVITNIDKPWVEGMQWRLSGTHPEPDICDKLALETKYGLGLGVYPRHSVPRKPHPQCMCYITPSLQDEDDFVAAYARGAYDDYFTDVG